MKYFLSILICLQAAFTFGQNQYGMNYLRDDSTYLKNISKNKIKSVTMYCAYKYDTVPKFDIKDYYNEKGQIIKIDALIYENKSSKYVTYNNETINKSFSFTEKNIEYSLHATDSIGLYAKAHGKKQLAEKEELEIKYYNNKNQIDSTIFFRQEYNILHIYRNIYEYTYNNKNQVLTKRCKFSNNFSNLTPTDYTFETFTYTTDGKIESIVKIAYDYKTTYYNFFNYLKDYYIEYGFFKSQASENSMQNDAFTDYSKVIYSNDNRILYIDSYIVDKYDPNEIFDCFSFNENHVKKGLSRECTYNDKGNRIKDIIYIDGKIEDIITYVYEYY